MKTRLITAEELATAEQNKSRSDSELIVEFKRQTELMLYAASLPEPKQYQVQVQLLYSDANYVRLPNRVWRPVGRVLSTHLANDWRGLKKGTIVCVPIYIDAAKAEARERRSAFTQAEALRFKKSLTAAEEAALAAGGIVIDITTPAEIAAAQAKKEPKAEATLVANIDITTPAEIAAAQAKKEPKVVEAKVEIK